MGLRISSVYISPLLVSLIFNFSFFCVDFIPNKCALLTPSRLHWVFVQRSDWKGERQSFFSQHSSLAVHSVHLGILVLPQNRPQTVTSVPQPSPASGAEQVGLLNCGLARILWNRRVYYKKNKAALRQRIMYRFVNSHCIILAFSPLSISSLTSLAAPQKSGASVGACPVAWFHWPCGCCWHPLFTPEIFRTLLLLPQGSVLTTCMSSGFRCSNSCCSIYCVSWSNYLTSISTSGKWG